MLKDKKLIIWDFDGVISETESFWVKIWANILKEKYQLNLDFNSAYELFVGISLKTKFEISKKLIPNIDEKVVEEYKQKAIEKMENEKFLVLTKDIEDIFKDTSIKQCIGTGGPTKNTFKKIEVLDLLKYFDDKNVFTAEMVEHGKPEPDIFLYAVKQMGFELKDCIIIEDSKAGVLAALKSGIDLVVLTEHQLVKKEEFILWAKEQGATRFADNVAELKKILYI